MSICSNFHANNIICSLSIMSMTFYSFTECRCNPIGSTGKTCHRNTGNCWCRPNVVGRACDKCANGFWNLEAGVGCQSCDCDAGGSRDGNCSAYTGQCNCKVGAGGQKCEKCLEGFYGLSASGCKRESHNLNR